VTPLPGTTRDALYESASISGVPVRLIDTAGIRETSDVVESIGISRSRAAIADADVILLVIDASLSITEDDLQLLDQIPAEQRIVAFNKCDLPFKIEFPPDGIAHSEGVRVSALTGEGFDQLAEVILQRLSSDAASERDDLMITDARQEQAIRRTIELLDEARSLMIEGELEEIILLRLRGALSSLGQVTGETLTDDILDQIFSTFCIGK
jgi:tRNA modification GTPase